MSAILVNALAGGGVGAFLVLIAYIIYVFIKKLKNGNKQLNTNNININNQQANETQELLQKMIFINAENLKKLDTEVQNINNKLEKISNALILYVSNNGVSDEVKKEFKEILKEK